MKTAILILAFLALGVAPIALAGYLFLLDNVPDYTGLVASTTDREMAAHRVSAQTDPLEWVQAGLAIFGAVNSAALGWYSILRGKKRE